MCSMEASIWEYLQSGEHLYMPSDVAMDACLISAILFQHNVLLLALLYDCSLLNMLA